MPVNYDSAPGGITLETGFLKEAEILERYIGNKLWAWGRNSLGQLGKNDRTHRSSPVQEILGGTSWKFIAFGGGLTHSAAIKTDGTLWAWGRNTDGQLGKNDTQHGNLLVQVDIIQQQSKQMVLFGHGAKTIMVSLVKTI
jgi:alpha-tubulin suppressor-like RCC1 family protein